MAKQLMTGYEKLKALREFIAAHDLGAYIVPRADEYLNDYVPACAERLSWLSGFTGSAGTAVITPDQAVMFTDSRYILQARAQLESDTWSVLEAPPAKPEDWIKEHVSGPAGFDPRFTPIKTRQDWAFENRAVNANPIDDMWADQPAPPASKVFAFPENVAGRSFAEKIDLIADIVQRKNAGAALITKPDSIAWLLNIRGSDVPILPVALSFGLLDAESRVFQWFISPERLEGDLNVSLSDKVAVKNRKEFEHVLARIPGPVMLDDRRTNVGFDITLNEAGIQRIYAPDPCIWPRAIKTVPEQDAMRRAHIADGLALCRFLYQLERIDWRQDELSEYDLEQRLLAEREKTDEFVGPSFPAIVGFGANGAIVHYRAIEKTAARIRAPGLLLIDSGGQYRWGTTDITRTLAIGDIDPDKKVHFTAVLKAHIAVAAAEFPEGTTGKEIDTLARQPLKDAGLEYAHGTGHGVGVFLSVHEPSANLSPKGDDPLQAGMILSNEPGYYKEGSHGIRIENLVLVEPRGSGMLGFETISFAPIDRRVIDDTLLTDQEQEWLSAYHAQVFEKIAPHLGAEEKDWLKTATGTH